MPLALSRARTESALRVELRLAARLDEVSALAQELRGLCRDAAVGEELASDLELATVEAANNIVLHALRGQPDATFAAVIELSSERLSVELADGGRPMEADLFSKALPDDPLADSGRGMAIIRSCADQVSYARQGSINRLVLTKHLT